MDINDLIKKLLDHVKEQTDESNWLPVAQLKPEDITFKATWRSEISELKGRAKVLVARLEALRAEIDAKHAELWERFYSTYSLPRDHEYTIDDKNNRILKKPNGRDGVTCVCGNCK